MNSSADSSAWSKEDNDFFNNNVMNFVGKFMSADGAPLRVPILEPVLKTGNQCAIA
jgi:hypothetical protein